jgi:hypothetical protein
MIAGDWEGLLAFADKHLLAKPTDRRFDQFPPDALTSPPAPIK